MTTETAILEPLTAAAERGDVQAVIDVCEGDLFKQMMSDDVKFFRSMIVGEREPKAMRPGLVAAALAAIKAAVHKTSWIATAREKRLQARVTGLEERLAALETRVDAGLEYLGTHEHGKAYRRNAAVTHDGNIWISMRETRQRPGDGPDWKLAVRKGRDALR